jgi:WD40 repeat protein
MKTVIAALVLATATVAAPAPPPPVDAWIEQLGHAAAAKRVEARLNLQRLGEPALAKVEAAAQRHPVPAVRQAAAEVAGCIRRGEVLAVDTGGGGYWLNRVTFTADGRRALVTGGAVITVDLVAGKEIGRDLELQFARLGLAVSADGKRFATGHQRDPVVRVGDADTRAVTQTLSGHTGGVHAVAFSPAGDRLVSGGSDGTLRLWDLAAGKELRQFPGITDQVRSVDYSADGKRILTGHFGPKSEFLVRLWDVDHGTEIRSLKAHTRDVSAVQFLPGGKAAVSAAMDGAVIAWDLDSGKEIRRLAHPGGVYGAAVSADGKRLLTAGFGDRTVRLWDLESGKELKSFPNHGGAALGVAFSADGRLAVTGDARSTVRLWRLPK